MSKKDLNQLSVSSLMILLFIFGCSAPIQLAADLVGNLAANALKPEQKDLKGKKEMPNIQINELVEEVDVGNNVVKINRGWSQKSFSIVFSAFGKQGELIERIFKPLPTEKYFEEIKRIKSMSEKEKKEYVRNIFLSKNIDLGPIEPETAEKPPAPSAPAPSFPVPAFTPAPLRL